MKANSLKSANFDEQIVTFRFKRKNGEISEHSVVLTSAKFRKQVMNRNEISRNFGPAGQKLVSVTKISSAETKFPFQKFLADDRIQL